MPTFRGAKRCSLFYPKIDCTFNWVCLLEVIQELALYVGQQGHTFMPAIMEGARQKENFRAQQVFALDFDGGISIAEFMARAEQYEVLPAFVYETFSSTEEMQQECFLGERIYDT